VYKYLIHGKGSWDSGPEAEVGELTRSEDLLTSDVFGTMACHLPPRLLLLPFLRAVATVNHHARGFQAWVASGPDPSVTADFWQSYRMPELVSPWRHTTVQPDLVLKFPDGTRVMLEAKFTSSVDLDQLARELLVARSSFGAASSFLLLVTADLVAPVLGERREPIHVAVARRLEELALSTGATPSSEWMEQLLWCNWQTVHRLAASSIQAIGEARVPDEFVGPVRHVLTDLVAVLDIRGLSPFRPLSLQALIDRWPDVSAVSRWVAARPRFAMSELVRRTPAIDPVRELFQETLKHG
jgi:hypothetical protein